MSTTIPALTSVTDILDNDLVMITHSNGESFKIAGSEINKRNQAVIASTTTMTGAPLKTGNIVRVYFTADITGSNTTTGLVINYNNVNYSVKVPKNGTLANFVASDLGGSPAVYKYLQANTMIELLYDGTNFIIIGNPKVININNTIIYADGTNNINEKYITSGSATLNSSVLDVANSHIDYVIKGDFCIIYFDIIIKNEISWDNVLIASNIPAPTENQSLIIFAWRAIEGDTGTIYITNETFNASNGTVYYTGRVYGSAIYKCKI